MKPTCAHCRSEISLKQWMTSSRSSLQCKSCGFHNRAKMWVWAAVGVMLLLFVAFAGLIVIGYTQDRYNRNGARLLLFGSAAVLVMIWTAIYFMNPLRS